MHKCIRNSIVLMMSIQWKNYMRDCYYCKKLASQKFISLHFVKKRKSIKCNKQSIYYYYDKSSFHGNTMIPLWSHQLIIFVGVVQAHPNYQSLCTCYVCAITYTAYTCCITCCAYWCLLPTMKHVCLLTFGTYY